MDVRARDGGQRIEARQLEQGEPLGPAGSRGEERVRPAVEPAADVEERDARATSDCTSLGWGSKVCGLAPGGTSTDDGDAIAAEFARPPARAAGWWRPMRSGSARRRDASERRDRAASSAALAFIASPAGSHDPPAPGSTT